MQLEARTIDHSRILRRSVMNRAKRYWVLYVLLLLPMAYFVVFRYMPMPFMIQAFKQNNIIKPIWQVPWAKNNGLEFFLKAFKNLDFWYAVRNTLMLNILDLVIGFPAPIILAIILNELRFPRFKRLTQTIAYMPHFLSWVIIYGLAMRLFAPTEGLINILLTRAGFSAIHFMDNPTNWIFTYVFLGIWQSVGWNTIIYLAAITNINPELYEAARVDGAKRMQEIWHVTLPSLRPTIIVLLVLSLGNIMGGSFDRPYVLRNMLVNKVSDVISIFVYRNGIQGMQFSLTTAVGLFQSVINVIFLVLANLFARRIGERGLL
ncbi:sugar ABC transporter permease [Clostridia bacterium]|nr:sugar ABC transporter permease [Clostridia bacterium]